MEGFINKGASHQSLIKEVKESNENKKAFNISHDMEKRADSNIKNFITFIETNKNLNEPEKKEIIEFVLINKKNEVQEEYKTYIEKEREGIKQHIEKTKKEIQNIPKISKENKGGRKKGGEGHRKNRKKLKQKIKSLQNNLKLHGKSFYAYVCKQNNKHIKSPQKQKNKTIPIMDRFLFLIKASSYRDKLINEKCSILQKFETIHKNSKLKMKTPSKENLYLIFLMGVIMPCCVSFFGSGFDFGLTVLTNPYTTSGIIFDKDSNFEAHVLLSYNQKTKTLTAFHLDKRNKSKIEPEKMMELINQFFSEIKAHFPEIKHYCLAPGEATLANIIPKVEKNSKIQELAEHLKTEPCLAQENSDTTRTGIKNKNLKIISKALEEYESLSEISKEKLQNTLSNVTEFKFSGETQFVPEKDIFGVNNDKNKKHKLCAISFEMAITKKQSEKINPIVYRTYTSYVKRHFENLNTKTLDQISTTINS